MNATNRRSFAQILLCRGCCCGKTERGFPPVPVDTIKAYWREHKLNRFVQLTVSGCLGPCDQTNVVLIITPERQIWLGGLSRDQEYQALGDWARDCGAFSRIMPLPALLSALEIRRWNDVRIPIGE